MVLICGKFLDPWPNAIRNLFFFDCQALGECFWFHSLCLVVELHGCVTLFSAELVSVYRVQAAAFIGI
jgi:hypothetical protein